MNSNEIPSRPLGKTGLEVSILGLGGAHIGYDYLADADAVELMRRAIDAGITFFDNSWDYNNGRSEERMGAALRDGYRDRIFLMTKFDARNKAGALKQLDDSLRRLQTDYLDLWQIHAVATDQDIELVSAPGGALEALDKAKRSGKIRFAGFTGHTDPLIHLRMLGMYSFDTCQMPINVMDAHYRSFVQKVVPVCIEQEVGIIGMKSFGDSHIVKSGIVSPQEALGYALSMPVSTLVSGMDSMQVLDQNLDVARRFKPLPKEQIDGILSKTAPKDISGSGKYEVYKNSK
ncbi:MAG: aldo/keto reductase [Armatimonadota bacterium]